MAIHGALPGRLRLDTLRGDVFGGVTAAVVALPLALAFGVASGVGPIAGLYGAIAVGFFAAVFGGTPAQVSGPTGPMTVVMAVVVAENAGSLSDAFAIVFLGGVLQTLFGVARLGRYVSYTPQPVVSGFMSGIGVIIILIQTLPFFGLATATGGPLGAVRMWAEIPAMLNPDAVAVAGLALLVMIFWPPRWRHALPPPLAALLVGTVAALSVFQSAPTLGHVPTGLPTVFLPSFAAVDIPRLLQPALILALLGSIDSLLTSLVADSITRSRHRSNRELVGQGIGNMVAGLIGGLPGAGATMRTVVNVRAGGRTAVSGALHALVLLALVLGLAPMAERIPHAVLAGILIKVGWDIIDWGHLKRLHRAPPDRILVMLVTLGLTVFVDLITAVAVGLILAGFATARWMDREELKGVSAVALPNAGAAGLSEEERAALARYDGHIGIIKLRGHFSYASARHLVARVGARTAGHKVFIYDFTDAAYVDTSAALAIEELIKIAVDETDGCFVAGLSGEAAETLAAMGALEPLPAGHVKDTLLEAIEAAGEAVPGGA